MEHATQVALTKDVFRHIDARTTDLQEAPARNPVSAYVSLKRLAREQQVLFKDYRC